MHDLIIVGGGPAALAAAVYALDKQLDIRIIAEELGGRVGRPPVPAAPTSAASRVSEETAHLFERVVSARPDRVLHDRVVDLSKVDEHFAVETQRHGLQESVSVIVATGVSPLTLDVPGARQWLGYGLGYSPTTYAQLLAGKTVAVVGATPRALRGAAELARTAAQVYLIVPQAGTAASGLLTSLRQRRNVVVLEGYQASAILGRDRVERLGIARNNETSFVPADAVFADLGLLPHSEMVRRIVTVDQDGFIVVDERHATNIPGLFAAGDVSTRFSEHIVVALGDGARAAISAYDYVLGQ